jgi:hypothetical protein
MPRSDVSSAPRHEKRVLSPGKGQNNEQEQQKENKKKFLEALLTFCVWL